MTRSDYEQAQLDYQRERDDRTVHAFLAVRDPAALAVLERMDTLAEMTKADFDDYSRGLVAYHAARVQGQIGRTSLDGLAREDLVLRCMAIARDEPPIRDDDDSLQLFFILNGWTSAAVDAWLAANPAREV